MSKYPLIFLVLLSALVTACTSSQPSPFTLSADAEKQRDLRMARVVQAIKLLEAGEIRAGQSLGEFLNLCTPYQIEFVDRFAFIEFFSVPNLVGLSLVAVDGKLASASNWSCTQTHDYFNVMTDAEKQLLLKVSEVRGYSGC